MKLFLLILLNVTRLDLSVTIIIEAFIDYRSQLQINVFKVATPLSLNDFQNNRYACLLLHEKNSSSYN